MKTLTLIVLVNSLQLINCNEDLKFNLIKRINNLYNDLITGKLSANSYMNKTLNAKSDNFDRNQCNIQLKHYMNQFSNEADNVALWAMEMFDASGKIPEGVLNGNEYSLGNFEQCLGISHDTKIETIGTIIGQYCLIPMIGSSYGSNGTSFTIYNGVCVPASCNPEYVLEFVGTYLADFYVWPSNEDPKLRCHTDSPIELSATDIVMIVILSVIVALMIGSTAYDAYTSKLQKPQSDLFMAFSVITNSRKLFECANPKSTDAILCLSGIRVLSLVWVIFLHTNSFTIVSAILNKFALRSWMFQFFTIFFNAGDLSVDSFFLMGGLLATWSVFKELNKTNGKLNIGMLYLHRYLRLTPPLIMVMLLSITFIAHTGFGPFSKISHEDFLACEKWWWSSLLYIQNYVNEYEMCIGHSWYLQVDMQLYILSPLLLIPLWKWGRNVLPALFTLILFSCGYYFAAFYINDLRVSRLNGGGTLEALYLVYFPTHTRMGTWLLGVLLAYILIKTKNKKFNFSARLVYGGWVAALGIMFTILLGQYIMNQPDYIETSFASSAYSALHRVGWCTGLMWIIFACHRGYGGYINSFLSHPMWLPFTRLSYSMYLVSYLLQGYRTKISKVHIHFSNYSIINSFWGDFGITVTLSIFWVLAFESPVPVLEKVLFARKQKSKPMEHVADIPPIEVKSSIE